MQPCAAAPYFIPRWWPPRAYGLSQNGESDSGHGFSRLPRQPGARHLRARLRQKPRCARFLAETSGATRREEAQGCRDPEPNPCLHPTRNSPTMPTLSPAMSDRPSRPRSLISTFAGPNDEPLLSRPIRILTTSPVARHPTSRIFECVIYQASLTPSSTPQRISRASKHSHN